MAKTIAEWLKSPWLNDANTLETVPWQGDCAVKCLPGYRCMAIGNVRGILSSPHFCMSTNESLYCPVPVQTTTTACPQLQCPETVCPDVLPPVVEQASAAVVVLAVLLFMVSLYGLWVSYILYVEKAKPTTTPLRRIQKEISFTVRDIIFRIGCTNNGGQRGARNDGGESGQDSNTGPGRQNPDNPGTSTTDNTLDPTGGSNDPSPNDQDPADGAQGPNGPKGGTMHYPGAASTWTFERASTVHPQVFEFGPRFPRIMRLPSLEHLNTQSLVNIPLNDPGHQPQQPVVTQDDLEPLLQFDDNNNSGSNNNENNNGSLPSLYSNSSNARELLITIVNEKGSTRALATNMREGLSYEDIMRLMDCSLM